MDKFKLNTYENAKLYKEKTKRLHDQWIVEHCFEPGRQVLLYNSQLKLLSSKLKSRWSGPFTIAKLFSYGAVELIATIPYRTFKVNG
ncbi:Pol polyprotein [Quillaja saponaria]|uniref:Pol polyprotein n=1 Tax=Quillaja saponaria TaxID=32244 RepID=A0AAD7Q7F7_QUISA|nr:Pol polyprotein [Quillaja saponaria]